MSYSKAYGSDFEPEATIELVTIRDNIASFVVSTWLGTRTPRSGGYVQTFRVRAEVAPGADPEDIINELMEMMFIERCANIVRNDGGQWHAVDDSSGPRRGMNTDVFGVACRATFEDYFLAVPVFNPLANFVTTRVDGIPGDCYVLVLSSGDR
jgi:hypothetical protein